MGESSTESAEIVELPMESSELVRARNLPGPGTTDPMSSEGGGANVGKDMFKFVDVGGRPGKCTCELIEPG